ncbi:membrane protein [Microbacterium phage ValentiniPuff]|uniref:Membrane protein n=1 Tax=Microbacterium phage ValentiniPuff TaxID=2315705 RepID=A0A386KPN9_9CAUD|nr:membrane protein [Microbacterium phage ValentiniPuff]
MTGTQLAVLGIVMVAVAAYAGIVSLILDRRGVDNVHPLVEFTGFIAALATVVLFITLLIGGLDLIFAP